MFIDMPIALIFLKICIFHIYGYEGRYTTGDYDKYTLKSHLQCNALLDYLYKSCSKYQIWWAQPLLTIFFQIIIKWVAPSVWLKPFKWWCVQNYASTNWFIYNSKVSHYNTPAYTPIKPKPTI
mgnify:CR=1 FL=1